MKKNYKQKISEFIIKSNVRNNHFIDNLGNDVFLPFFMIHLMNDENNKINEMKRFYEFYNSYVIAYNNIYMDYIYEIYEKSFEFVGLYEILRNENKSDKGNIVLKKFYEYFVKEFDYYKNIFKKLKNLKINFEKLEKTSTEVIASLNNIDIVLIHVLNDKLDLNTAKNVANACLINDYIFGYFFNGRYYLIPTYELNKIKNNETEIVNYAKKYLKIMDELDKNMTFIDYDIKKVNQDIIIRYFDFRFRNLKTQCKYLLKGLDIDKQLVKKYLTDKDIKKYNLQCFLI